ncbi:MAG: Tn3 family transposase [Ketobacter sp.]|nr:Tn3 family transposase [Planctomycetota bacterium]MCP5015655.1 Tn3 family transposase [Ketobacter sp.]
MPDIHETIYPTLSSRYSDKVLHLNFTPTAADIAFVKSHAKQAQPQTFLLIMLKVTQHLHYIPSPEDIPYTVVKYVANTFIEHRVLQKQHLSAYQRTGTYNRHCRLLRNYLNLETHDQKRSDFCEDIGVSLAEIKDSLVDIINALIEALITHQFELPAFSTIERIARRCRHVANENLYHHICQNLSDQQIDYIASLFEVQNEVHKSPWQRLKQEPDKPSVGHIRTFLDHLAWLKDCAGRLPSIESLPVSKREHFRYEAMALHSSDMRDIKSRKRHALAVVLVNTQLAQAYDDLTDMLRRVIGDVENEGKQSFQSDLFESRNRANGLITQFRDILDAYQSSVDIKRASLRLEKIDAAFSAPPDELLNSCDTHLALVANNELPHVVSAFSRKRKLIFKIYENLPIQVDPSCHRLLELGNQLLDNYRASPNATQVSIQIHDEVHEFLPRGWDSMIFPDGEDGTIHRISLEAAWFIALKAQLKTFNCYVVGGQKYGNPNHELISWEEYPELAQQYEALSDIPIEGRELVKHLKDELATISRETDEKFPNIQGAHIKDDQLVIQRAYTKYKSDTLEGLRNAIKQRMPKASIIDVITDTVRWLDLERLFKPHSGFEGKLSDHRLRLIVTLFCYGCNVGAQQTKDSIKILTRKQVAWLNARYCSVKTLEKAIKKAVDTYNKMALPKQWGDGTHAAADGTHRSMYDANLLSEFHLRYLKRGAIGYYIVSDKYIALFSHFIACGVHESWYILDGVSQNDMDIKPTILHGDTHAQNYVVFGLAYLLGIQLMPRIRGIKHLSFFRANRKTRYKNIDSLFSEAIQWQYIEKSLPEMLRIVLSIRAGKITPSAILRRLNTYSQKNHLYRGFQELGKVARTIFLLKCISDPELRKIIHRETNKAEQFHEFMDWLFFGNGGIIRENDRIEQDKIIKYHHLVSSLVVLYNTHHMTKALDKLREENFSINMEDVKHLSPYMKSGINLLGNYHPDLKKRLEPIMTELAITEDDHPFD